MTIIFKSDQLLHCDQLQLILVYFILCGQWARVGLWAIGSMLILVYYILCGQWACVGLWAIGSIKLVFVRSEQNCTMSYILEKPKMRTLSPYLPSPNCVQSLSNMKNGINFNVSGQCLDKLWIFLSNLCPSVLELDIGLTQF